MKKRIKRIITLSLSAALVISMFVGCGKQEEEVQKISSVKAVVEEEPVDEHPGETRSPLTGEWIPDALAAQRPIAVMESNNKSSLPQYSLTLADVVYEAPMDLSPEHLISPCDSKLTVHKIGKNSIFRIKGSCYRVSDLVKDSALAEKYSGGYCLIFRLEVDDYHRYCYIDNGSKSRNIHINGELHTVNPIALGRYNIYKRNSREYTVLHTDNFGDVVQVEVGAMMVGRIVNHDGESAIRRGEEKGMFEFGGSTIVMLFEKDRIAVDSDILRNSAEGNETVVKYGEKIGERK